MDCCRGFLDAFIRDIHTPDFSTWLAGFVVGIPAGLLDIGTLADLSNIGTLFAFALVAGGVLILRYREPDRPAGVPRAGRADCAGADDLDVPAADGGIAHHELDPLLCLVGHRVGDLLFLWPQEEYAKVVRHHQVRHFPGCSAQSQIEVKRKAGLAVATAGAAILLRAANIGLAWGTTRNG